MKLNIRGILRSESGGLTDEPDARKTICILVGKERVEKIMNMIIDELVEGKVIHGETVVMDATFIKAYSKRDSHDNHRGSSDPDARVGRDGNTYDLG